MKDIALYIQSCTTCQRVNNRMERPAHSLHPIVTTSGNSYIVTCSDYFTKWPEAAAIPDKSAATVAKFLYQLITRHGSPTIIQSDQGREFVNQVLAIYLVVNHEIHYDFSDTFLPTYLSVCDYSPRNSA